MGFTRAIAFMIGAIVPALLLHGCGCDKEEATKCSEQYTTDTTKAGSTVSKICKGFSDWTTCLKDSSCCDFEENGAKVSDAVAAAVTQMNSICKGDDKVTDACA